MTQQTAAERQKKTTGGTVVWAHRGHDLRGEDRMALVITVFSLVGFESATALGGEARKPLRNIPRAVVASLLLTGAFMVFMS